MGREGVAFTFVTPEEGNELTRIEMRINRLLKRDEIPGFEAYSKPQPRDPLARTGEGGHSRAAAGDEEGPAQPAPKPVFGRHTRRIRRAL